jgi:hypothetical protein
LVSQSLFLLGIGLIRGEHRHAIGIDGLDFPLHQDRRKMKVKSLAPAQFFSIFP